MILYRPRFETIQLYPRIPPVWSKIITEKETIFLRLEEKEYVTSQYVTSHGDSMVFCVNQSGMFGWVFAADIEKL